jgi:hypothetical protein
MWGRIKSLYQSVPDEYSRIAFWVAVFLGIPTAMMWSASRLWWFWHWFGLFGIAFVGLVTVAMLLVILAAYRHYRAYDNAGDRTSLPDSRGNLVDNNTKSLAGKIVRVGEVARMHGFTAFHEMTQDAIYFRDIMSSAHAIWSNSEALQLRRDFENQIGRIAEANKERDFKGRQQATGDLGNTIVALTKILLGHA